MNAQFNLFEEINVDNFAGGGGASTGIELATGRIVDIAINHDPAAILMHQTNHPFTEHYQESVWDIDPVKICRGRSVGLAWFSPDCKHFSKAKGAALVDRNIRGLAWIVLKWAGLVRPRVIILENVEEFITWGPVRKGKPIKNKSGQTFKKWLSQLKALGYDVEYRTLVAADYGTPTSRKRFFLVARCDGKPIVWPKPTHAPKDDIRVKNGELKPYRTAADIIDWSLPCPSIFDSKQEVMEKFGLKAVRPLADNTMRRIARGLDKFVIKNSKPFIVPIGYGERKGQAPRIHDVDSPLPTVTSIDHNSLCVAHIAEFKGQDKGQPADNPLRTITAGDGEFGLVKTMIVKIKGNQSLYNWPKVREMLNTHCSYDIKDDEMLLFHIGADFYFIADIGLRMLCPKELYAAMGFPADYIIDCDFLGNEYKRSAQVARCGNAVCPQLAKAIVSANLPEYCSDVNINLMSELADMVAI